MTEPVAQEHDRDAESRRLYSDLASWWHLISAPEEYVGEAASAASLLRTANPSTRTVLELGSGGGNNAFHLKSEFEMTLVDLSDEMLAVPSTESGMRAHPGRYANSASRPNLRRGVRP